MDKNLNWQSRCSLFDVFRWGDIHKMVQTFYLRCFVLVLVLTLYTTFVSGIISKFVIVKLCICMYVLIIWHDFLFYLVTSKDHFVYHKAHCLPKNISIYTNFSTDLDLNFGRNLASLWHKTVFRNNCVNCFELDNKLNFLWTWYVQWKDWKTFVPVIFVVYNTYFNRIKTLIVFDIPPPVCLRSFW